MHRNEIRYLVRRALDHRQAARAALMPEVQSVHRSFVKSYLGAATSVRRSARDLALHGTMG
ncbi:hypothetical protein [Stakelama tenebrarum]|uniref:Uncharacterized protein n=1 Tax=Stakelama tenebrarum TaxID=2711215 RepID=A0A6G6Y2D1_9SPHN|nr:hypothetical protein [Sphingosinithalassobacter tenebrarum]QIG78878.1 hypothetical protein G5C33_03100 [Sphingosinithalassobacter tenebrarum]